MLRLRFAILILCSLRSFSSAQACRCSSKPGFSAALPYERSGRGPGPHHEQCIGQIRARHLSFKQLASARN